MSQDTTDPVATNPLVSGTPGGAPEPAGVASMRPDVAELGEFSDAPLRKVVFDVRDLNVYYGSYRAVRNVNMAVRQHEITAFIGPSGCGLSLIHI